MRPQYITIGAQPKVLALDTDVVQFQVSIRTDAGTVEVALEHPSDAVAPNSYRPPIGPALTWVAAPAAGANGIIVLDYPVAAVRFTGGTVATVLQQGLR